MPDLKTTEEQLRSVDGTEYVRLATDDGSNWRSTLSSIFSSLGSSSGVFTSIATQVEAETGTDNSKGMTPLRVAQAIDAQAPIGSGSGIFTAIATETEAETGIDNTKGMTPLRVAQAIAVQAGGSGVFSAIASQAEAEAGSDNTKGMTPLRVAQAIDVQAPPFNGVITSVATGAVGATFELYQNSASPAQNDYIGLIQYTGNNASAAKKQYGEFSTKIFRTTAGAEVGTLTGQVMCAGTLSDTRLGGAETFLLGYQNPPDNNFEYVYRGPSGFITYMFLESFDGGTVGPSFNIWHASPSPAVNDVVGAYTVSGITEITRIDTIYTDVTGGSEDADLVFKTKQNGTMTEQFRLGSGAWSTYTPTITSASGTFTSTSATGRYYKIARTYFVRINVHITTNGTAAGEVRATLPSGVNISTVNCAFNGSSITSGAELSVQVLVASSPNLVRIAKYDTTYPGGDNVDLSIAGFFEAA